MKLTKSKFEDGLLFTLENSKGLKTMLTDFGASITGVSFLNKDGKETSLAFGSDDASFYKNATCYMGSSVGRFANRIIKGKFSIDGKEYNVGINEGKNHLHGGVKGFSFKKFASVEKEEGGKSSVTFSYRSFDGEEGYPGNVDVFITYTLTDENELIINYKATTDKTTPINLTNHAYWNLNGKGTIKNHKLTIDAPFYLPVDSELLTTGEVFSVKNTPFDFTKEKVIGDDIDKAGGYDHCFVFADSDITKRKLKLFSEESKIALEIFTDKPAIQFYSGNALKAQKVREGVIDKQEALCLETEFLPCAPNYPHFAICLLYPGHRYNYTTIHKFSVEK